MQPCLKTQTVSFLYNPFHSPLQLSDLLSPSSSSSISASIRHHCSAIRNHLQQISVLPFFNTFSSNNLTNNRPRVTLNSTSLNPRCKPRLIVWRQANASATKPETASKLILNLNPCGATYLVVWILLSGSPNPP
ncbi:hypothetical protein V6Z11_A12G224400 [Gossypium hirsutum]